MPTSAPIARMRIFSISYALPVIAVPFLQLPMDLDALSSLIFWLPVADSIIAQELPV